MKIAIIGASVCLALGISLPILRLTKFIFWTSEYSLISTVEVLLRDGQTFLGLVVLVFSILLPVVKLGYLLLVSTLPAAELRRHAKRLKAIEWIGKWSMHDVLVLETREVDPVSLVRFNNVLLTKGALTQFEEMLG